ncbi:hypothetical protein E3N88_00911 [Mikania micrantha]|uniref:Uncharacterized protein n=1 Tax=Mikania micrantha TaxID=192012 RepID=A0A5N6PZH5_9ASTR|nr:hypothetical protein E3N88_00911 [Mikania micrantha]
MIVLGMVQSTTTIRQFNNHGKKEGVTNKLILLYNSRQVKCFSILAETLNGTALHSSYLKLFDGINGGIRDAGMDGEALFGKSMLEMKTRKVIENFSFFNYGKIKLRGFMEVLEFL